MFAGCKKSQRRRGEWKSWLKTRHSKNEDCGIHSHHFMANGETMETVTDFIFLGSKIPADGGCSHEIKRCLLLGRNTITNLDSILKSRDIILPAKVHLVKTSFFSSHVWMWELDYKESWETKNRCFWTVVPESSLDCKEIQPVQPKGNQSWVFIGRTDVEAETLNILATWCEELTHLKRPWCWERLKAGGEGDDRR